MVKREYADKGEAWHVSLMELTQAEPNGGRGVIVGRYIDRFGHDGGREAWQGMPLKIMPV